MMNGCETILSGDLSDSSSSSTTSSTTTSSSSLSSSLSSSMNKKILYEKVEILDESTGQIIFKQQARVIYDSSTTTTTTTAATNHHHHHKIDSNAPSTSTSSHFSEADNEKQLIDGFLQNISDSTTTSSTTNSVCSIKYPHLSIISQEEAKLLQPIQLNSPIDKNGQCTTFYRCPMCPVKTAFYNLLASKCMDHLNSNKHLGNCIKHNQWLICKCEDATCIETATLVDLNTQAPIQSDNVNDNQTTTTTMTAEISNGNMNELSTTTTTTTTTDPDHNQQQHHMDSSFLINNNNNNNLSNGGELSNQENQFKTNNNNNNHTSIITSKLHYHCPHCTNLYLKRADLIHHLGKCCDVCVAAATSTNRTNEIQESSNDLLLSSKDNHHHNHLNHLIDLNNGDKSQYSIVYLDNNSSPSSLSSSSLTSSHHHNYQPMMQTTNKRQNTSNSSNKYKSTITTTPSTTTTATTENSNKKLVLNPNIPNKRIIQLDNSSSSPTKIIKLVNTNELLNQSNQHSNHRVGEEGGGGGTSSSLNSSHSQSNLTLFELYDPSPSEHLLSSAVKSSSSNKYNLSASSDANNDYSHQQFPSNTQIVSLAPSNDLLLSEFSRKPNDDTQSSSSSSSLSSSSPLSSSSLSSSTSKMQHHHQHHNHLVQHTSTNNDKHSSTSLNLPPHIVQNYSILAQEIAAPLLDPHNHHQSTTTASSSLSSLSQHKQQQQQQQQQQQLDLNEQNEFDDLMDYSAVLRQWTSSIETASSSSPNAFVQTQSSLITPTKQQQQQTNSKKQLKAIKSQTTKSATKKQQRAQRAAAAEQLLLLDEQQQQMSSNHHHQQLLSNSSNNNSSSKILGTTSPLSLSLSSSLAAATAAASASQKDMATCQFCGRQMLRKNIPTHIRRAHTPKEELVCLNEEQNIFTFQHLKPGQRRKRSARAYDYSLMTATVSIDEDPCDGIENKFITEGQEILSTDLIQLADRVKYGVSQIQADTLSKLVDILNKIEYSNQGEIGENARSIKNTICIYLASNDDFKFKLRQVSEEILDKKSQVSLLRNELKDIMTKKAQLERKIQPLVCELQKLEDNHGFLIDSIYSSHSSSSTSTSSTSSSHSQVSQCQSENFIYS